MILRAFLVIISGFIFIFSPGLPMNLISRFSPDYKRDLVYWGIGGWFIATFFSLFIKNIINGIVYPGNNISGFSGQPSDFVFIFVNSFISSTVLGFLMRFILKNRIKIESFFIHIFNMLQSKNKQTIEQDKSGDLIPDGLALGFGTGLIAQVFTGISMVGAGFQVLFGNNASNVTVKAISESSFPMLITSILTLILFRVALLAISAVQGVLTARSILTKIGRFWSGVLVTTLFTSLILMIQLLMGESMPGQVSVGITPASTSIISSLYYLLAFFVGYRWLIRDLQIKNK